MGFLREQMGEEELRHLLQMLSEEAGAHAGRGGAGRAGCRVGRGRRRVRQQGWWLAM